MPPRSKRQRRRAYEHRRRLAIFAGLVALCIYLLHAEPDPVPANITETEALARVIRSEIGSGTPVQRMHVAWAARNLADEKHMTIVDMACSPCGRQQRGRPVSTRQSAREQDRKLAKQVLATPKIVDPTGGATHFINPVLQDRLAKSGSVLGYRGQTYRRVRKRWIESYGWEPYYQLGPTLEMWGPARGN